MQGALGLKKVGARRSGQRVLVHVQLTGQPSDSEQPTGCCLAPLGPPSQVEGQAEFSTTGLRKVCKKSVL